MLKNPVIIIHYHLRPGGVTKVIESQVNALVEGGIDYLVLTGEAYAGAKGIKQHVIPDLCYLTETDVTLEVAAERLWEQCQNAIKLRFYDHSVTWLVHNPSLGKNVLWPSFLSSLAHSGNPILFQCHDFAEDGRPNNYKVTKSSETIYPLGTHIHYGFINSRDLALLRQAGLPAQNSHLIPNEVSPPKLNEQFSSSTEKVVLYPVRGIRRKNVGEFLLWSILAPQNTTFALTLAPKNPDWLPYYRIWENLAAELELDIHLGCVDRVTPPGRDGNGFEDWLMAATHCFTSSIAEGFGLSFLEPLALGKSLIGRDLVEITCDFKDQGITFDSLYEQLLVPSSSLNIEQLIEELIDGMLVSYEAYGRTLTTEDIDRACDALIVDVYLDFGNLPEHHQVDLITKAAKEGLNDFLIKTSEGTLINARDWFAKALTAPSTAIQSIAPYEPDSYKDRLLNLLQETENSERKEEVSYLDKEHVLSQYLDPSRFHFLRT